MSNNIEYLYENTDENYLYSRSLSKYAELNQDMYIWILQDINLDENNGIYWNDDGEIIGSTVGFVVEGKKIERAKLPQLNLILQSFNVGGWESSTTDMSDNYTWINFNFPTAQKNRKFTIKIGKVTDDSILTKIRNNDYSGITDLLNYAKKNNAIYTQNLATTREAYFRSDSALFDGKKLLENKAYYYIYVKFDDENGKYYPIEGVTLGQAYLNSTNDNWDLWAYTADNFKWDGLTVDSSSKKTTSTANKKTEKDNTTASGKLPYTGTGFMVISLFIVISLGLIFYVKYNRLKNID